MAETFVDLVRDGHLDEAESALQKLNDAYPETVELRIFPAMLAIQRGRVMDALRLVNELPDAQSPELRALCLRLLNDPTWHVFAEASLEHPDPYIRRAMRNLLDCSDEADIHPLLKQAPSIIG